ncbi:hypothetical protein [Pseudomonas sp. MH9.3]|uniref:hypothetical protein n=1 Tax=Pseudomonas sp. MH9.3 TaxID=3048630 RepID=UPI002AC89C4C|nr:hypothetical protein [Pseudomonas sp. MH9.3]MEB0104725.1 hypothetical protein [Pseudomonas sp. MH9.3]WPX78865.1 hypothetical protein RHM60_21920 [Pseudomonas sp. MH9.3]WQG58772.1 hypothetical protein RHM66_04460 [Pseudomonas sp. RTB3]
MTRLWMLGGALLFAPLTQASPQIHVGGVYDCLDAGQSSYLKQVVHRFRQGRPP